MGLYPTVPFSWSTRVILWVLSVHDGMALSGGRKLMGRLGMAFFIGWDGLCMLNTKTRQQQKGHMLPPFADEIPANRGRVQWIRAFDPVSLSPSAS